LGKTSCVCVNHLNRCKTSTRLVAGGHGSIHQSVDQLHVPALFQFHFFVNGNRLSPEPACRNLHFSVVTRGILHLELRSKRELQNSLMKNYDFFDEIYDLFFLPENNLWFLFYFYFLNRFFLNDFFFKWKLWLFNDF